MFGRAKIIGQGNYYAEISFNKASRTYSIFYPVDPVNPV